MPAKIIHILTGYLNNYYILTIYQSVLFKNREAHICLMESWGKLEEEEEAARVNALVGQKIWIFIGCHKKSTFLNFKHMPSTPWLQTRSDRHGAADRDKVRSKSGRSRERRSTGWNNKKQGLECFTFSLSLMDPFPRIDIFVRVSSCSLFNEFPRGPRSLPTKLNCNRRARARINQNLCVWD